MIPNAEIEGGYRALVELGALISRAEIVAVLEAAQAARGAGETEPDRLRELIQEGIRVVSWDVPSGQEDARAEAWLKHARAFLSPSEKAKS